MNGMLMIPTSSFPTPLHAHLKTDLPTAALSNPNGHDNEHGGGCRGGGGGGCVLSPIVTGRRSRRGWAPQNSATNNNQTVAVTQTAIQRSKSPDGFDVESTSSVDSTSNIVRKFYEGINRHDLASVEDLIAENCVYEDLIFPRPFIGRKAILEFFKKFTDSVSADLQFVIDDISNEDTSAVGVIWHLEWKGKPFPFSKGCSFYQLEVVNGQQRIIYGRDSVEPAIKPGETALVAIRGVAWLLQQFPQLADRL